MSLTADQRQEYATLLSDVDDVAARFNTLTRAEREVVTIIAETGVSNKELGYRLRLSESAIKLRVKTAMMRLGAQNRVQLVIGYWKTVGR